MQIVGLRKYFFVVQLVFWGASKFFGGPVTFQIYWPPGPLDPQAQCQGLLRFEGQGPETRRDNKAFCITLSSTNLPWYSNSSCLQFCVKSDCARVMFFFKIFVKTNYVD